ncbi:MAG: transposase [Akkermansiaceae bacterium]|jgi:putative transposase|nr:transposase [Akkermansiaceae bacterium]MDP4645903.1 transposase [Akkermansiaceae bacterium]MDP4720383.1 transposase [Akkermansiaceae bacterium]MDP4779223.1 transposase [Akkermansiaceae bacterium]MDP4848163.1 transposase [Akkermansiaceae bacterium]
MRFFDKFGDTIITRNHLPHWQQMGATYFVTWRLGDSMPRSLLDALYQKRDVWMKDHPQPWTEEVESEYHRLYSTEIERMMDLGHGTCILKTECRIILSEVLGKFGGERFVLHSWVAMPNHVHILFTLEDGIRLEDIVGAWKRYSSMKINRLSGGGGALWQKDYYDRLIRDWEHFFRVARYIRKNPKKAKLADGIFTLWEADWVKRMLG